MNFQTFFYATNQPFKGMLPYLCLWKKWRAERELKMDNAMSKLGRLNFCRKIAEGFEKGAKNYQLKKIT